MYGFLADGTEPLVGMGVSIEDKGSEVALGRVTYLDKSDEEIRVEFLAEYAEAVCEHRFKFAKLRKNEIWVVGKFLRKVDDDEFQKLAAASSERLLKEEAYLSSPEFLRDVEAGTSEYEPTWRGGSWSAKAAEDCYGLRKGMRFRYVGRSTHVVCGCGFIHDQVVRIESVRLSDPFYVWPDYAGPIAVCIDWGTGKSHIARQEGKLASRFGQTIRHFMANFKYVPPLVVTIRPEPSGDDCLKVVCYSIGGDALCEVTPDPTWSIEELEAKLLALDGMSSAAADREVVFALPNGSLVAELPRDMTVDKALAA